MPQTEPIQNAVDQLSKSSRGRGAMESLLQWISQHGCGLDSSNWLAVHALLDYTQAGKVGTVTDAMRASLRDNPPY